MLTFALKSLIEHDKMLLNTRTCTTSSGRIWAIWVVLGLFARQEPGSTEINWQGGHTAHIRRGKETLTIPLSHFQAEAQRLVQAPARQLQDLLPEDLFKKVLSLPKDLVQGFGVPEKQENQRIFDELKEQAKGPLGAPCHEGEEEERRCFLSTCTALQHSILKGMVYGMGAPPRAFQLTALLFTGPDANLFLHKGTTGIAFPKAKQKEQRIYDTAWALPQALGAALLFYVGVIRPLEIEALGTLLGPEHSSHIFVRLQQRHKSVKWNCKVASDDIGRWLESEKNSIPSSVPIIRQFVVSLLHEKGHGSLCTSPRTGGLEKAIDDQAQHTKRVGDVHYGASALTKHAKMNTHIIESALSLSAVYHRIVGIEVDNH
jgi:hypothetical protein